VREAEVGAIGAGIVLTPAEGLACEQLLARGFFQTDCDIGGLRLPLPRGPFRL